jgi:2-(1,2-epoxy-1,2-dihydrophenyl)acetyl-CoA isomerase
MKNNLIIDNEYFTAESTQHVAILKMKGNPLYQLIDLQAKATLFECMEELNNHEDIRVVVILGSDQKPHHEAYIEFFRRIGGSHTDQKSQHSEKKKEYLKDLDALARFCNAVNQLVLKIVGLNKFVIHADSGLIISPLLNLSLACDYRIVGQKSAYENPYLELGLVPKGGSAFFLKRLIGYQKTLKVLLADRAISADESLALGMVDQVAPSGLLYETAVKTAHRYALVPPSSSAGIKRLINCPTDELEYCLKREDDLFIRIINSRAFMNRVEMDRGAEM